MKRICPLTATVTISLALLSHAQAQAPVTNGLLAYYPLNGNVSDASGKGNNGTAFGGVSYVPGRPSGSGVAANFNGNAQYITLPTSISNYQDLSVSFWIKTSASNPNQFPSSLNVVSRDIPGYDSDWTVALGLGRKIEFQTCCDNVLVPSNDIASNEWVYVVCVADSINQVKAIYVDGQMATSVSWQPYTFANNNVPIVLGSSPAISSPFLVGEMANVRFYNRALSASEVQQIYQYESNCVPHPAAAIPQVVNGFVVAANIIDAGCGYSNTPIVLIEGGGGTGAAATAVVENGFVTEVNITDAGSGYTNPPTILIGSAPSIATQPQSVTVHNGDNVSFNVTLANPTPVAYQWLFDSNSIPGATFSTLTISNVTQTNLGAYSVVLTSPFGTTNSSDAILSMYPFLVGPFGGAVTLWGTPATLSVQAVGSDPLSYQWYQNGVAVPNGTNAVLSFDAIQFTNAGLYSVVVSNPYGSVTNAPAQVVVNPAGVSFGLYPGITVSGVVGYNYAIQRTTDLSNTNAWVTMTNLTLAQPVELWVDTSADASLPANPHHFYRVLPGQ